MTSPVDIANIALTEVGHQETISSFDEGSPTANVVKTLYQSKIDALSRAAHWNCLRTQSTLTQIRAVTINGVQSSDPPPVPWYYEYLYPPDCLKARYIVPYSFDSSATAILLTTAQNASPWVLPAIAAVPFIVGIDTYPTTPPNAKTKVILTNALSAILVQTTRIDDPTLWDAQFVAAATSFLGAWFINALGRNRALANDQANTAQAIIQSARVTDGNEGPSSVNRNADWIAARGAYALSDGIFYASWDQVAFPGGLVF